MSVPGGLRCAPSLTCRHTQIPRDGDLRGVSLNLSELPSLLGAKPVRSELTHLLVSLDKDYTASQSGEPWETYYAQRILDHFSSSER
jgi:hypothetical protein